MQKLTILSLATLLFFPLCAMEHSHGNLASQAVTNVQHLESTCCQKNNIVWFKAVRSGNTFRIHSLLRLGFNVNAQDEYSGTALHIALTNNKTVDMRMLTHLLDSNANLNLQDQNGNTPLHIAVSLLNKYLTHTRKTTTHGDLVEKEYKTQKQELYAKLSSNSEDNNALVWSLMSLKNKQKQFRATNNALIESYKTKTKLYCSAAVQLLVNRASTTIPNQKMAKGQQTVRELWPDILKNLNDLVCVRAITLDEEEIVTDCLKAGIDPNSPQEHIGSFLTWAVEHKATKCARQILYHGGSLVPESDTEQEASLNALHIAAIQKNTAMVKVLVESPQASPSKPKSQLSLKQIQQEIATFVFCCAQKEALINTLNNGEIVHSICQFLLPNPKTLINEIPLGQLTSFVSMRLFQKYFYKKQEVIDALTERHLLITHNALRIKANLSAPLHIMPCELARINHDMQGLPFVGTPNETSKILDPEEHYLEAQKDMIKRNYARLIE